MTWQGPSRRTSGADFRFVIRLTLEYGRKGMFLGSSPKSEIVSEAVGVLGLAIRRGLERYPGIGLISCFLPIRKDRFEVLIEIFIRNEMRRSVSRFQPGLS
jgi:hypothetical protein